MSIRRNGWNSVVRARRKPTLKVYDMVPPHTVLCRAEAGWHQVTVSKAYLLEKDGRKLLFGICMEHFEPLYID